MSDAFVARYLFAPPDADRPAADPCATFAAGVRAWLAHVNLPVPPPPADGVPTDVVLAAGRKRVRWVHFSRPAAARGTTAGDGAPALAFAEVVLRRPDPAEPAVIWTTRASAVVGAPDLDAGPGVSAAVLVRVSAASGVAPDGAASDAGVGEERAPATAHLALPPALLPALGDVGTLADAAGEPFHARPLPLDGARMGDFVDHVLCDPRRERPLVVLTPGRDGDYPVLPSAVAREFFGLADVYLVERPNDTFALTDALGDRALSAFWGAMRVYGPGFTRAADPYAHPLLFPERAAERSVRDALRRRLALGTVRQAGGAAARVDARLDVLRLEAELRAELRAELLAGSAATDACVGSVGPAVAGTDVATSPPAARRVAGPVPASTISASRERQEVRLDALRAENARLRAEVAELRRRAAAPEAETVEAVVAWASERLGDALYFLPSAYRAARVSPFRRPDEVRRMLEGLARVARQCQQGPVPGGLREACRQAGLDYASGAAESTSARLRAQYVFRDGARAYTCVEHVRKGVDPDPAESLRIYFTSREPCDERFVVGHVGAHLRTMTTN